MIYDIDDLDLLSDRHPGLMSLPGFLKLVETLPWFRAVGEPLSAQVTGRAEAYANALGFPDAVPALVPDWVEASESLESVDINAPAWEVEESLRTGLAQDLVELLGDDLVTMLMTHVSEHVSPVIEQALLETSESLGISDDAFLRAGMGGAVQACHQAVMVALAGEDDGHPFTRRFGLYEAGRWPIGIFGTSFLIY